MISFRRLWLAAALALTLGACAQMPAHTAAGHAAPAGMADHMAMMDAHMKAMREMHDKMSSARTPDARQALMAEHMKLMHEGMGMMGGMGMGAMKGPADMPARQQMMEKRMEMMHSMMQMMMDRMPATPPAAK
jgi:hypothetical protein